MLTGCFIGHTPEAKHVAFRDDAIEAVVGAAALVASAIWLHSYTSNPEYDVAGSVVPISACLGSSIILLGGLFGMAIAHDAPRHPL
jgi:hypothetical protein